MTIGDELRHARERSGWTLEALAERTRIQRAKIEALEQDALERLPDGIYLDGIIRACARELDLDADALIARLRLQRERASSAAAGQSLLGGPRDDELLLQEEPFPHEPEIRPGTAPDIRDDLATAPMVILPLSEVPDEPFPAESPPAQAFRHEHALELDDESGPDAAVGARMAPHLLSHAPELEPPHAPDFASSSIHAPHGTPADRDHAFDTGYADKAVEGWHVAPLVRPAPARPTHARVQMSPPPPHLPQDRRPGWFVSLAAIALFAVAAGWGVYTYAGQPWMRLAVSSPGGPSDSKSADAESATSPATAHGETSVPAAREPVQTPPERAPVRIEKSGATATGASSPAAQQQQAQAPAPGTPALHTEVRKEPALDGPPTGKAAIDTHAPATGKVAMDAHTSTSPDSARPSPSPTSPGAPPNPLATGAAPAAAAAAPPHGTPTAPASPATADNVSGTWQVATEVERSGYQPFQGLRLGYRLRLNQTGTLIHGDGVKIAENGEDLPVHSQTAIHVQGTINGDRVVLTFTELGTQRVTDGRFVLYLDGLDTLRGRFATEAAQSSGIVEARRVKN